MSGLGGHIKHLYEDYSLTFSDIQNIINLLSTSRLPYTEKTDGMNLYLNFDPMSNKALMARNKEDLESGGVDLPTFIERYKDRPEMQRGIKELVGHFENSMSQLDPTQLSYAFKPKQFYSVELHHPKLRNLIPYDRQGIIFHKMGGTYDIQHKLNLNNILSNLGSKNPDMSFGLDKTIEYNSENHIKDLNNFMSSMGLTSNSAVGDYVIDRVAEKTKELPISNEYRRKELIKKTLGIKSDNINNIITGLNHNEAEQVKKFVSNSKLMIKDILLPLEKIINKLSVDLLNNVKSDYIIDTKNAIQQIKFKLSEFMKELDSAEDEELRSKYSYHKDKMSSITTPVEGIVFVYKNTPYKLTGNFAPANQIKIMSEKLKKLREEKSKEKRNPKVAVFAGSFRPPHAGHMKVVENLSEKYDEVVILVSDPKDKQRSTIKAETSKEILETYLKSYQLENKCKVSVSSNPSSVKQAYGYVGSRRFYPNAYVDFITSDKDKNRYEKRIMETLPATNRTIVSVQEFVLESYKSDDKPMSATNLRETLKDPYLTEQEKKIKAYQYIPAKLSEVEKQKVYELMKKDLVQEMSGMSGGAVSGYSAPLGKDEQYESMFFGGIVMSDSNPFKKKQIDEVYNYLLKKVGK